MGELIGLTAVIFGIGGPILVIYLFLLFANKRLALKTETLIKIVEHGATVEPDMLRVLNEPAGREADLRKGLIWLAIGIPAVFSLLMLPEGPPWVLGLIPVFIGLAYLLMMKLAAGSNNEK